MFKLRRGLLLVVTAALVAGAQAETALAQANCEAIPAGPARTDCYMTLGRIGAGNAAIAGTKARVETDKAALQQISGKPVKAKPKPRRKAAAPKAPGN